MKTLVRPSNVKISDNSNVKNIPLNVKNFGLTQPEFDQLVVSLKQGKEELFEKIFLAHFDNCQQYLITNHNASFELAYDITMDTLIQFRQRILTDKMSYGNLRYLFTVMASQNLFKHLKKGKNIDLSPFYIKDSEVKSEKVYEALTEAWNSLESSSKKLLEEYYYNKTPLIKIANRLGISDSTMRKKKQRCLEKLRNLFLHKYSSIHEE